jgi:TctA family transporter
MELLMNLGLGFETAFTPVNMLYCFVGVLLGTLIGVLPGIGRLRPSPCCCPSRCHCRR